MTSVATPSVLPAVKLAQRTIGGSVLQFVRSDRGGERHFHIMGHVRFGEWPRERRGEFRTLHYGHSERFAWESWHGIVRACLAAREPKRRRKSGGRR